MKWIIRLLLVYVAVFSLQRIHISREPEREGKEDEAAVLGYDIISRGPVMKTERFLALRGLRHMKPQGTLIDVGCLFMTVPWTLSFAPGRFTTCPKPL
jgi:hypothetical protein